MKFGLLFYLLFMMTLSCYASDQEHSLFLDTTKHTRPKKITNYKPHITYSREFIKGYKPSFDNCHFTKKYTAAQRLKMYPFAVAAKILAVAYFGGAMPNQDLNLDSTAHTLSDKEAQQLKGLVIKNHRLDYSTLIASKILNQTQISHLTNIIFNYEYTGMKNYKIIGHAACFDPRNSIIFLDKSGHVIDHLDICFSCHNNESPSNKITVGTECKQKYDMLSNFFVSIGIPYGTSDRSKWKSPLDDIKK